MTAFRISVHIIPRRGLLDPQGKAVTEALLTLGFSGISDVHVGRFLVIEVTATDAAAATDAIRAMCERLLANPVTEDFEISAVVPVAA